MLPHGADKTRIGPNQMGDKASEGTASVKERIELAATQPSFWQGYKFMNPVSKQVEPKKMYCERPEASVVCAGVYGADG